MSGLAGASVALKPGFVVCHIDKEEVVEILTMKNRIDPKSQKLRSQKIDLLKQKGDYR